MGSAVARLAVDDLAAAQVDAVCFLIVAVTKQSMGYLVDSLERRGYLERRLDPTDRRVA